MADAGLQELLRTELGSTARRINVIYQQDAAYTLQSPGIGRKCSGQILSPCLPAQPLLGRCAAQPDQGLFFGRDSCPHAQQVCQQSSLVESAQASFAGTYGDRDQGLRPDPPCLPGKAAAGRRQLLPQMRQSAQRAGSGVLLRLPA